MKEATGCESWRELVASHPEGFCAVTRDLCRCLPIPMVPRSDQSWEPHQPHCAIAVAHRAHIRAVLIPRNDPQPANASILCLGIDCCHNTAASAATVHSRDGPPDNAGPRSPRLLAHLIQGSGFGGSGSVLWGLRPRSLGRRMRPELGFSLGLGAYTLSAFSTRGQSMLAVSTRSQ